MVSDTSPLRALSAVNLLPILHTLYGEIVVPPAVAKELTVAVLGLPTIDVTRLEHVRVQIPTDTQQVTRLRERLGEGESEAIALALETGADALLIDEAMGRRIAAGLGLHLVGVIGILLEAKQQGLIDRVGPLLDTLDASITFRISAELRTHALKLAGEQP